MFFDSFEASAKHPRENREVFRGNKRHYYFSNASSSALYSETRTWSIEKIFGPSIAKWLQIELKYLLVIIFWHFIPFSVLRSLLSLTHHHRFGLGYSLASLFGYVFVMMASAPVDPPSRWSSSCPKNRRHSPPQSPHPCSAPASAVRDRLSSLKTQRMSQRERCFTMVRKMSANRIHLMQCKSAFDRKNFQWAYKTNQSIILKVCWKPRPRAYPGHSRVKFFSPKTPTKLLDVPILSSAGEMPLRYRSTSPSPSHVTCRGL